MVAFVIRFTQELSVSLYGFVWTTRFFSQCVVILFSFSFLSCAFSVQSTQSNNSSTRQCGYSINIMLCHVIKIFYEWQKMDINKNNGKNCCVLNCACVLVITEAIIIESSRFALKFGQLDQINLKRWVSLWGDLEIKRGLFLRLRFRWENKSEENFNQLTIGSSRVWSFVLPGSFSQKVQCFYFLRKQINPFQKITL